MKTEPNDPAHPSHTRFGEFCPGLTKREHFAGEAMKGLLCNPHIIDRAETLSAEYIAKGCLVFADALISALNREQP